MFVEDVKKDGWQKAYKWGMIIATLLVAFPILWLIKLAEFMTKETMKFYKNVVIFYLRKMNPERETLEIEMSEWQ